MDKATIFGIIFGSVVVLLGMFATGDIMAFADMPSVYIVIGAVIGTFFMTNPWAQAKKFFTILGMAFRERKQDMQGIIPVMVSFAEEARREGLLVLEDDIEDLDDEFLKKGIQLVVDGTDPELVKSIMNTQMDSIRARHTNNRNMILNIATLAPAFGMIGTLIGLIQMLGHLDDPDAIGPNMSVALITTMYGSIIANLYMTPLAYKLMTRSEEEMLLKEIMVEGMLSIQAGDNPRIVEEKLKAYLPPEQAASATTETDGGEDE